MVDFISASEKKKIDFNRAPIQQFFA